MLIVPALIVYSLRIKNEKQTVPHTGIRPQKPVVVDRIERDIKKLTELYEEGYRCAEQFVFRF